MHRPQLYRLQYQKQLRGNLKKFWRKKMFSLKSMTKLEDLTVLNKALCSMLDTLPGSTDQFYYSAVFHKPSDSTFCLVLLVDSNAWLFCTALGLLVDSNAWMFCTPLDLLVDSNSWLFCTALVLLVGSNAWLFCTALVLLVDSNAWLFCTALG